MEDYRSTQTILEDLDIQTERDGRGWNPQAYMSAHLPQQN